jgi:hypothetical protein
MESNAEKERLHRLWGAIFEEYVNWILRESVDNKLNILHESPIFEDNGEQVCDAIVICGSEAAFLEYKGATFTARAKYSGDIELLTGEIDKKLAHEDDKKGVYQLSRSITDIFRRSSPRRIKGIDISKIAFIYPVLVTRDSLGGSIFLSWYLNTHYKRKINRKLIRPFISTPLFCMSVQGIEELSGYLKEASMTSILYAWYKKDPQLISTYLAVDNSVTRQIGQRSNKGLDQALDKLWDDATNLLFPGHTPITGPIEPKHLLQA